MRIIGVHTITRKTESRIVGSKMIISVQTIPKLMWKRVIKFQTIRRYCTPKIRAQPVRNTY